MLNMIWALMILLAVVFAACTGQMSAVTNAALDSAGEAVSLCITMAGVVALWTGLMEIAGEAGLVEKLTRGISPFLSFLFPRLPKKHPARGYIATNIIANVLGLGWACTPAGLKAMEELAKLEAERGTEGYAPEEPHPRSTEQAGRLKAEKAGEIMGPVPRRASSEMCNFLILNISSLQLIPVNMIAYRSQYGSARPAAIIAPAIAATLISTVVAVIYCKIKDASQRGAAGDGSRCKAGKGSFSHGAEKGSFGCKAEKDGFGCKAGKDSFSHGAARDGFDCKAEKERGGFRGGKAV